MTERIEKIMKLEQFSASRFADEIGVQRSSISHLFSGRNNPSLELVQKILQRFSNLNPEWLLMGKGDIYKKSIQQSLFDNSLNNEKHDPPAAIFEKKIDKTSEERQNIVLNEIIPDKLLNPDKEEVMIKKIIVFYSNNSFTEFLPA